MKMKDPHPWDELARTVWCERCRRKVQKVFKGPWIQEKKCYERLCIGHIKQCCEQSSHPFPKGCAKQKKLMKGEPEVPIMLSVYRLVI